MKVYAEKNSTAAIDPTVPHEASSPEELSLTYTSDSYQKILDYRVVEIFLTTIVFGVIVLLRLHH